MPTLVCHNLEAAACNNDDAANNDAAADKNNSDVAFITIELELDEPGYSENLVITNFFLGPILLCKMFLNIECGYSKHLVIANNDAAADNDNADAA